jgi:hypothetical protein
MVYYFDVKETFIKTVGVEAEDLQQAYKRILKIYNSKKINFDKQSDEISFNCIQDEIENSIMTGDIDPKDIDMHL